MGKTEQTLRQRHYGHRREVETRSSALGQHFADCGLDNLRIQVRPGIRELVLSLVHPVDRSSEHAPGLARELR